MMRIGHGYDVHKLVAGRKCIIGGVDIPSDLGLLGHSDADVLLHAISDSILGAAAMGDIGHLFPDTDDKWKGADSLKLLEEVVRQVNAKGYKIVNIDSTILAQVCQPSGLQPGKHSSFQFRKLLYNLHSKK